MVGDVWRAAVHGVSKGRARLSGSTSFTTFAAAARHAQRFLHTGSTALTRTAATSLLLAGGECGFPARGRGPLQGLGEVCA